MKAPIANIIPISFVDGPGSRTVIFFQGCNLKCSYCHNPETQNMCNGCGNCASFCPCGAIIYEKPLSGYEASLESSVAIVSDNKLSGYEASLESSVEFEGVINSVSSNHMVKNRTKPSSFEYSINSIQNLVTKTSIVQKILGSCSKNIATPLPLNISSFDDSDTFNINSIQNIFTEPSIVKESLGSCSKNIAKTLPQNISSFDDSDTFNINSIENIVIEPPIVQKILGSCSKNIPNSKPLRISSIDYFGTYNSKESNKISFTKNRCVDCGKCIETCNNYSNPKYSYYSVESIIDIISENVDFIDGITVSGGECTLYLDFLCSLFEKIKATTNLTIFVDTNGLTPLDGLVKLFLFCDGFIFDIKALDSNKHISITSKDNTLILQNLLHVYQRNLLYQIRTVLIEDINDTYEDISKLCYFIFDNTPQVNLKLIPFRPEGVRGLLKDMPAYSREKFQSKIAIAKNILGSNRVIYSI